MMEIRFFDESVIIYEYHSRYDNILKLLGRVGFRLFLPTGIICAFGVLLTPVHFNGHWGRSINAISYRNKILYRSVSVMAID